MATNRMKSASRTRHTSVRGQTKGIGSSSTKRSAGRRTPGSTATKKRAASARGAVKRKGARRVGRGRSVMSSGKS